ncbi:MAG TPA: glycine betaine/L-proline ABC transporter ATP-binding protein [Geminicoccaceae bacterium]|jgi:glycine betaine/proline transport system ATP-binding protein|nr:glycine betaine/L-proline ABC transporter ATP-binding protein [Geminicoccaceae bacterium]
MSTGKRKIRVRNLSKIFGGAPERALDTLAAGVPKDKIFRETGSVVAVADVSFDVGEGEVFVVMGLSGSGKSTLVRCINRLIEPTVGQVLVDDQDVTAADQETLRRIRLTRIAMVFQHFALFPHKTVAGNVEFGLKVRGMPPEERRERALRALDLVGLRSWADTAPDNLSGGMQQRVGLARALAVDPEVLLMDEPFSALDPLIRRDMQKELIELQRRLGMTIVFITHDLHEALTLGDHIAIMKDGSFMQVGSSEEIVASPADPYVASFTQDVDRGRVITARRVMRPADILTEIEIGTALDRLGRADRGTLFVVEPDGRPIGLLFARDVHGSSAAALGGAIRRDFPRAAADAKLAELFEACALGLPIAVVERDGRLAGVVHPGDVFIELARESRVAGAADKPPIARTAPPEPAALETSHG